MHLFFFVRGAYHAVEIFKTLAQCQFFKWKRINLKTGKEEIKLVQGALRPTFLGAYEYIFPEESLSDVLSMFGIADETAIYKQHRLIPLRLLFGCKRLPKKNILECRDIPNTMTINGSTRGLSSVIVAGAGVYVIGIKKDKRGKMYGFEQEAL